MKKDLMNYIVCPTCKGQLLLTKYEEEGPEIMEGLLACKKCKTFFPIIDGVPRILQPDFLLKLVSNYESFLNRHNMTHPVDNPEFTVHSTDEKIAKGFEFEWQKHSEVLPEHNKEFLHVLGDLLSPSEIKGKTILDAGCGQGRFSYFLKKYGASTVVSFDLGEQTLIAQNNLKGKNVHVVQASIYDPPFKSVFDLVISIGVIHHLPDPEKGFRQLFQLLKVKGKIFIWVYGYSSIIPVIRFLRSFTLNRGVKFNRFLGFFFAIPLYLINQFYNLVRRIPIVKKFAELIPFHMYYDRGFSNIWTICFDKINSGIAVYYKRSDLQGWLDRLTDKKSGHLSERYPGKSGSSWRLMAKK